MHPRLILVVLLFALSFSPSHATSAEYTEATRSKPTAQTTVIAIPAPRDVPFPGTIELRVDATDVQRRIFRVTETIPVAQSGQMTLLYPQWLPGVHGPKGAIDKLAGLKITIDGKPHQWVRDPQNVFAFHLTVPDGAKTIVAEFQYLSATAPEQGRVVMTDALLSLQWQAMSLYPAGYYARQIPIRATATYPDGWEACSAVRGKRTGATVTYDLTDYEVLVDSPVLAGRYFKAVDLGGNVMLDIFADSQRELHPTPEQILAHTKLVSEAVALFGARHYDHYDFLLSISDTLGHIGLEHHRCSENGVSPGYFTRWAEGPGARNLLPHEFTHSWNGKFRRSELLWTPNYNVPMQDNLLWVYEGQTQFWGYVLGARSGLYSKQQTLDALAMIASNLDLVVGRKWRPLEDTTHESIISGRTKQAWKSWQRAEDYYNEGLLMWLEVDGLIRKQTTGVKGMDDFAKSFFGINDGDFGEVTYNRRTVIDILNGLAPNAPIDYAPIDWEKFFNEHADNVTTEAPKNGLTLGGYKLVYTEVPSSASRSIEARIKGVDQADGIGLEIKSDGDIMNIIWDSPAFKAGLTNAMKVLAVNGTEFTSEAFKEAITAAKTTKKPLTLLIKDVHAYRTVAIEYFDGLRYPHLEKVGVGEGSLDLLLKARK
ncbi:MAG: peptidase M61 [Planctomycetota bacterium]